MIKYLKIPIILLIAVFLCAGSAIACPFSSTGIVNMNYNNSWDELTQSGTALFQLYIDEDWPQVNYVSLEFENDIFDQDKIDTSDFTIQNPAGWSTSISDGSNGYKFAISNAGIYANSANAPIEILFNYNLLSTDRYNQISGVDSNGVWAWDEDQAWAVTYIIANTGTFDISAGSTAIPTPEPATMLLLGCGFLGLAGFGRRKLSKR